MSYDKKNPLNLYHYVHCPYCIRVRMAFDFAKVPYLSKVVPYNDEKTPLELCQKKMLPIVQNDQSAINESLDIIKKYCGDKFDFSNITGLNAVNSMVEGLGSEIHSLAMPYFIWTPEFDEESRKYFQNKKEVKRGPFKDLMKRKEELIAKLNPKLRELEQELKPFYQSQTLRLEDIMVAAHLWALFIVPEFQFSEKIYSYLMRVKAETGFDYHRDYME